MPVISSSRELQRSRLRVASKRGLDLRLKEEKKKKKKKKVWNFLKRLAQSIVGISEHFQVPRCPDKRRLSVHTYTYMHTELHKHKYNCTYVCMHIPYEYHIHSHSVWIHHYVPAHLPYFRRLARPMPRGARKNALRPPHRPQRNLRAIFTNTSTPTTAAALLHNLWHIVIKDFENRGGEKAW